MRSIPHILCWYCSAFLWPFLLQVFDVRRAGFRYRRHASVDASVQMSMDLRVCKPGAAWIWVWLCLNPDLVMLESGNLRNWMCVVWFCLNPEICETGCTSTENPWTRMCIDLRTHQPGCAQPGNPSTRNKKTTLVRCYLVASIRSKHPVVAVIYGGINPK